MREDARAKAIRLLGEGRITVHRLTNDLILASAKGDSAHVYDVGWAPSGWFCNCQARARCSHIRAVQLITLQPIEPEPSR